MLTLICSLKSKISHSRLDLGRFAPILPGRTESEPPLTRHAALLAKVLVVLTLLGAVLTVPGAGPGVAAETASPPQRPATAEPAAPRPQAPATEAVSPDQPVDADSSARLDAAKQGLDQTVSAMGAGALGDAELARLAAAIPPVNAELAAVVAAVAPRLAALKARLDQLGAAPDPKAVPAPPPEDPGVARDRQEQTKLYSANDDLLKRANLLEVRAGQLAAHITERRRALFANEVFRSSSSIFAPSLWMEVARETPHGLSAGRAAFADFADHVGEALGGSSGITFAFLLLLVLMALVAASLVATRVIPRENARRTPNELQKAAAALWTALAVSAIPIAGAGAIYGLANWFGLDAPQTHPFFNAVFASVVRLALVAGLGTALLAPTRPLWRPLDLTDRVAQRVMTLVMTVAVLVTFGKLVEAMNEVIGASLQATVAARGLFALLVGLTLSRGLYGIVGHPDEQDSDSQDEDYHPVHLEDESPWWPPIRFAAWSATLAILVADVLGYIALAAFIVGQITWWSLIASLLFLSLKLSGEGAEQAFRPNSRFSRGLMASLGLRRESLQQIGVLLSATVTVALSAVAVLLLLAPWGLQSQDMMGAVEQAFFGVKVGDVTLSLLSLILAVALFATGYGLTHVTQNWLENRYLPLTGLDVGLRASIRTSVGYLGVIVTIALVFGYLGINTEKLALVAGALSVGIGLGLQSVVNNFVSGLILLWERAIRVGDWVRIGEDQGYVRRINVRSTEIETFDRATMIVPNGHMVTDIVKNFVRSDRVGRIKAPVQVIWGTDPEKVRDVLLDVAKSHEEVVGIPAPTVLFSNFTPTALEFELVCFVEDVEHAARVKSDLHYAIFKSFADAGLRMTPGPAAAPSISLDLAQIEPLLERLVAKPLPAVKPGDMKA